MRIKLDNVYQSLFSIISQAFPPQASPMKHRKPEPYEVSATAQEKEGKAGHLWGYDHLIRADI